MSKEGKVIYDIRRYAYFGKSIDKDGSNRIFICCHFNPKNIPSDRSKAEKNSLESPAFYSKNQVFEIEKQLFNFLGFKCGKAKA